MLSSSDWNSIGPDDDIEYAGRPAARHAQACYPQRSRLLDLSQPRHADAANALPKTPDGGYEIQLVLNGCCRVPLHGHVRQLGMGHIVICNLNRLNTLHYSDDYESAVLRVSSSTMQELCLEHGWLKPDASSAFSAAALSTDERQKALRLFDLIHEELQSDATPAEVLQHYARVLTCKLMMALGQPKLQDAPDSQAQCFARLVQYVDDNIRNDIKAEHLAQYAGLSVRSLYLLFEKNVHMTPKAYIREKKLEHVYSTLMDPASKVANVTTVALEYGFTHLGRFAELYRKTFGVLPSKSLKARHAPEKMQ